MIFVTDDHRTIRLAQQSKESRGVIPELDESLMRSLIAETSENPRNRIRVAVERRVSGSVNVK